MGQRYLVARKLGPQCDAVNLADPRHRDLVADLDTTWHLEIGELFSTPVRPTPERAGFVICAPYGALPPLSGRLLNPRV